MENLLLLLAFLMSPIFIYANLWWGPIIFLGGIISGEIFKKNIKEMVTPYFIVQAGGFEKNASKIIATVYTLTSLGLGMLLIQDDALYFGVYICFTGIMTSIGAFLTE